MAGENVEVVRRGLDAYNRRDMPAWVDCFDPAVEVSEDPSIPDAGSYEGHDGLLKWAHIMERNWRDFQVHPQRLVESGDDVIALMTVNGRSQESEIEVEGRFGSVFSFRDGRVVDWVIYAGWNEALEAVGLAE
jgi:uncharacterized protein